MRKQMIPIGNLGQIKIHGKVKFKFKKYDKNCNTMFPATIKCIANKNLMLYNNIATPIVGRDFQIPSIFGQSQTLPHRNNCYKTMIFCRCF